MVYGVGEHFEQLAKLEKLFRLPRLATLDNDDDYACGWTIPSPGSYVAAVQSPQFDVPQDVDPLDLPATATAQPEPPSPAPFIYRRVGTGCLAAMSPANPFPGKPLDWNWFFKAIPENHWKWSKRTGLSLSRPNGDYWKMLVPGVGRAPVKSFIVLVSIFALVIGPLNYLLLARARRLYLLLLTVPLGATLVTMGLFGFALAADGLGTRLRIRSYAELDQETGRVIKRRVVSAYCRGSHIMRAFLPPPACSFRTIQPSFRCLPIPTLPPVIARRCSRGIGGKSFAAGICHRVVRHSLW
jgi:hypothetical protein